MGVIMRLILGVLVGVYAMVTGCSTVVIRHELRLYNSTNIDYGRPYTVAKDMSKDYCELVAFTMNTTYPPDANGNRHVDTPVVMTTFERFYCEAVPIKR